MDRCICSSTALQVEGCVCGYRTERRATVQMSGDNIDIKVLATTDRALTDRQRHELAGHLLTALEEFDCRFVEYGEKT